MIFFAREFSGADVFPMERALLPSAALLWYGVILKQAKRFQRQQHKQTLCAPKLTSGKPPQKQTAE